MNRSTDAKFKTHSVKGFGVLLSLMTQKVSVSFSPAFNHDHLLQLIIQTRKIKKIITVRWDFCLKPYFLVYVILNVYKNKHLQSINNYFIFYKNGHKICRDILKSLERQQSSVYLLEINVVIMSSFSTIVPNCLLWD